MKIHNWYCHGLRASWDSQRRTFEEAIDAQIPVAAACRASSGHDQRDNGTPQSAGGVHATALTCATCTGVNGLGRPDRAASPKAAGQVVTART